MDRKEEQEPVTVVEPGSNKGKIVPNDEGVDMKAKKVKRRRLVSFWELPEYMKDNEYILSYYRADWSLADAFFSVFRLHNETLNVWTHLVGFILFLGLTIGNISYHNKHLPLDEAKKATRWPFYVFLSGSMFCLMASSVCHLFCCHSKNLNVVLLRIDYTGIAVMIITSFFPPMFYIFQCTPHWYFIYLGVITAFGVFAIFTLFTPSLSSPKYRAFRAILFVSMGLFGIIPAVHAAMVNWSNPKRNITLGYEVSMAVFYLVGTGFYVSRVPEKWKPGGFDLFGHSHQIFHVFVVFGALAHYGATLLFLDWRDHVSCHD
ncbi:PREDICTED: heptahelical transmembrane protein 1 [Tarenaya hassleriana]|uniref:heptahelical transmembrane protein 1 n=1 Tax=Tarenaya hassleriana TaxID=28532 RepID=UPI00053CA9F9|nr:PREDICTED: heptahelical transmembrane protein 1 [Tarenaya hassleriana]